MYFLAESEVGPKSSEVKVPHVEQKVVIGVGEPQSAPPIEIVDAEIVFKPTTGMATYISASSDRPDPPLEAIPGSVDVPARPEQASNSRHISGIIIAEEFCSKSMHVCPPHLFTVLTPYLKKSKQRHCQ